MNSQSDYDYFGLFASTWDLWRDDTSNWSDRHFFLSLVREFGEPVLDMGCGTGRLVLDYASLGIDVDGIDNSPDMLGICERKAKKLGVAPNLYLGSVETFELPRAYRTILAPSSVLQLITDAEAARALVRRCYDKLVPGGVLTGSFAFDWREGDALDSGWTLLFEKTRPEDGATVRSWTREWHEPAAQLWHSESRFEVELDGKQIGHELHRRSPEGRWYTQAQVVELFESAGFTRLELCSGFERRPATAEDRLFCAIGVKPH